jgi:hypothetical protein
VRRVRPLPAACLAAVLCPLLAAVAGAGSGAAEDPASQKKDEETRREDLAKILEVDPEIARAAPHAGDPSPGTTRRLVGAISAGGSFTTGNTSTLSLLGQASVIWHWSPNWGLTGRTLEFLQRAQGRSIGSTTEGLLRVDRALGEGFSLHAAGEAERRPFVATGLMYGGYLGGGYTNLDRPGRRMPGAPDPIRLELSAFVDRQLTTVPPDAAPGTVLPADSFTRAGVRALAGYAHLFGAKSGIGGSAELREDFVRPHHLLVRLGAAIYLPLVDQLHLKLGAAYRFDSRPILDDLSKGDLIVIWGLAYRLSFVE